METGWLDGVLRVKVGIFVERVRLPLPTLTVVGGIGVILRRVGVGVISIDMFNAGGSIVTINRGMSLDATRLAVCMGPHGWPRRSSRRVSHLIQTLCEGIHPARQKCHSVYLVSAIASLGVALSLAQ